MAGLTVWLTGLPSSGKTTLADALVRRLRAEGRSAELLDGDSLRGWLSPDLGYTRTDRDLNVLRIGTIARLLARNDVIAVVAAVSPFAEARNAVRAQHAEDGVDFLEVHVATSVACCARRDVKGLYARQRAGQLTGLTGVDAPYEPPQAPEARIDTEGETIEQSVARLHKLLAEQWADHDAGRYQRLRPISPAFPPATSRPANSTASTSCPEGARSCG